jgi:hypothetical protein
MGRGIALLQPITRHTLPITMSPTRACMHTPPRMRSRLPAGRVAKQSVLHVPSATACARQAAAAAHGGALRCEREEHLQLRARTAADAARHAEELAALRARHAAGAPAGPCHTCSLNLPLMPSPAVVTK